VPESSGGECRSRAAAGTPTIAWVARLDCSVCDTWRRKHYSRPRPRRINVALATHSIANPTPRTRGHFYPPKAGDTSIRA
jgi:hypothetical protein